MALGLANSLQAEEACLAAPTGAAPEGELWYYRTDPIKQIKCWHLTAKVQPAPVTQQNQLGPTPILPNQVLPSRSPVAKPHREGAQVEQALQGAARPTGSRPHVSQPKGTEPSSRQITDVPLPKPAPHPKELTIERVGTSETASVQASGAQTATATKIEGTQFSGPAAGANSQREAAPALLPWPDPPQNTDNGSVDSSALLTPSAGEVRQAGPQPSGAQAWEPLQSSETSATGSLNSQAASQEVEPPQGQPLSQAVAQNVRSPEDAITAKPARRETVRLT